MTLSTLHIGNYATIVYEGHAGFLVSTVGPFKEGFYLENGESHGKANGKSNGTWGYTGSLENGVYLTGILQGLGSRGYMGIVENKMETTIMGSIGIFRYILG